MIQAQIVQRKPFKPLRPALVLRASSSARATVLARFFKHCNCKFGALLRKEIFLLFFFFLIFPTLGVAISAETGHSTLVMVAAVGGDTVKFKFLAGT